MGKRTDTYEGWLKDARDNLDHFAKRDLNCDVPWQYLAVLIHERDSGLRFDPETVDAILRHSILIKELATYVVNNATKLEEQSVVDPAGGAPPPEDVAREEEHEGNRNGAALEAYASRHRPEGESPRPPTPHEAEAGEREASEEGSVADDRVVLSEEDRTALPLLHEEPQREAGGPSPVDDAEERVDEVGTAAEGTAAHSTEAGNEEAEGADHFGYVVEHERLVPRRHSTKEEEAVLEAPHSEPDEASGEALRAEDLIYNASKINADKE